MPSNLVENYDVQLVDIDAYGAGKCNSVVWVNAWYRSVDLSYLLDLDSGDLRVNGVHFSSAFRF